jgi:hypothetical protein
MIAACAALLSGCSHTDQTLESVSGTEPQRLSFGAPEAVQATFLQKMKACWFGGSEAPLHGYRFEAQTATHVNPMISSAPVPVYENIKIYDESKQSEAFEVQFHKYNDNTLISTRNLGLPLELASKLKKDIETWLLRTSDCE